MGELMRLEDRLLVLLLLNDESRDILVVEVVVVVEVWEVVIEDCS